MNGKHGGGISHFVSSVCSVVTCLSWTVGDDDDDIDAKGDGDDDDGVDAKGDGDDDGELIT